MQIRIGKQLTQAREALGLVVEDVAHRTKIPADTIRQLEREDYSQFANNVYAKSFLRLYGKHLGIDTAEYLAEHDGRLMTQEDEVAFLDGIALSPEFQQVEESSKAVSAAAAEAVATSGGGAETPGKISSGFMTVFLLLVVGVPTAFLLSKLYGDDDPKAVDGATVPPPAAREPDPVPTPEASPATPPAEIAEQPPAEEEAAPAAVPAPAAEPAAAAPVPVAVPVSAPATGLAEGDTSSDPAPVADPPGEVPEASEVPRAIAIEASPTTTSVAPTLSAPLAVE